MKIFETPLLSLLFQNARHTVLNLHSMYSYFEIGSIVRPQRFSSSMFSYNAALRVES